MEQPAAPAPVLSSSVSPSDVSVPSEKTSPKQTVNMNTLQLLRTQLDHVDSTIRRLKKLLASPEGLAAFLSTLNYTLYLVAHLARQLPPAASIPNLVRQVLSRARLDSKSYSAPPPTPLGHPVADGLGTLGSLISDARTTLRLTGLIPMYTWARSLARTKSTHEDPYIRFVNVTQCAAYITFQALENVAYLHDKAVIRLRTAEGSKRLWSLSCRMWLLGVSCDIARLARQATLERRRRLAVRNGDSMESKLDATEEKALEKQWWADLQSAACWLPVCIHYSLESGLKGMNVGAIGALGLLAEFGSVQKAWKSTMS